MAAIFAVASLAAGVSAAESSDPALWYSQPAKSWEKQALPLGNGRLGCMIFGEVERERIQFNEDSLWTGDENPSGVYEKMGAYQAFGDLFISMDTAGDSSAAVEDYRRELRLADGIFRVEFRRDGVRHQREVFASWPDQVIVIRWTAEKPGAVSGVIELKGMHKEATTAEATALSFGGALSNGMKYQATLGINAKGGSAVSEGSAIRLEGMR